jgi:hypothetical protein
MSITVSSVYFDVESSESISLNISATGIVGKFPSDVADNVLFDYGFHEEGFVQDGDSEDHDTDFEELTIYYWITVPDNPGFYTLKFYAANTAARSNSVEVYVSVGDSPTTTTPTQTTPPSFSWPDLSLLLSINFLLTWGFVILIVVGFTAYFNRHSLKNGLYLTGILIASFGWASYYFGFNPIFILVGMTGFLLAIYAERISQRKDESSIPDDNQ